MRCQLFVSGIRDPSFEACKAHVIAQGTMMSDFSAVKTYFTYVCTAVCLSEPSSPPFATSLPSSAGVDTALGTAKIGDAELDNVTRVVTAALLPRTRNSLRVM